MIGLGIEVIGPGDLDAEHDLFVGTLGYESRSTHLARNNLIKARNFIAFAFPDEDYASYKSNQEFLDNAGYEIFGNTKHVIRQTLSDKIREYCRIDGQFLSILIDISSMSRPMLAEVVFALSKVETNCPFEVTFIYLPAAFVKQNKEHAPVAVSQPVTPEYAGWTTTPELPITAVVGLGYEQDLALGALEYLEPDSAWAFVPTGEDARYDEAVKKANRTLRPVLAEDRSLSYLVSEPERVFASLETLVYGLLQWSRPILIPFGPKIFSLCCLLVARAYAEKVTVWRVSGEAMASPGDREASGKIVTVRTAFATSQIPEPQL